MNYFIYLNKFSISFKCVIDRTELRQLLVTLVTNDHAYKDLIVNNRLEGNLMIVIQRDEWKSIDM